MTPQLVKKLKWLEAETLALKQASLSGLNAVDFYRVEKSASVTLTTTAYELIITVQFADDVIEEPLTQLWLSFVAYVDGFAPASWDASAHALQYVWLTDIPDDATVDLTAIAISAQKPTALTIEAGAK